MIRDIDWSGAVIRVIVTAVTAGAISAHNINRPSTGWIDSVFTNVAAVMVLFAISKLKAQVDEHEFGLATGALLYVMIVVLIRMNSGIRDGRVDLVYMVVIGLIWGLTAIKFLRGLRPVKD